MNQLFQFRYGPGSQLDTEQRIQSLPGAVFGQPLALVSGAHLFQDPPDPRYVRLLHSILGAGPRFVNKKLHRALCWSVPWLYVSSDAGITWQS